jgi:hypothetical protein
LDSHFRLYAKRPVQALAPENQKGGWLVEQFGCFWASTVGVKVQLLQLGICVSQNHRARTR